MPFLKSPEEASSYYTTHSRDTLNIVDCLKSIIEEPKSPLTVLVVGCGNGQHDLLPLIEKLNSLENGQHKHIIFAVDKSESMMQLLENNLKDLCSAKSWQFTKNDSLWKLQNIEIIPICMNIEDNVINAIKNKINGTEIVFDLVILFAVLQHTTNWRQALNTLIHLVKPGGNVLVDEWFDSPLAMLDIAHKNPQWHYYFSLREKYTGIFWDPEVKAHDILAVRNYFLGHGFYLIPFFNKQEPTSSMELLDLTKNVKEAFGFGPLSWGKGNIFKKFAEEKIKNEALFYVPKETIGFKIYCFQKPTQQTTNIYEHAVTSANLITSTPVYETRIMNHFCVDINPSLLGNKTDIRQVQALQLGLQYSGFSARTSFAFPIQARIDIDTGMIVEGTEPVRTLLVPDKEESVDILTRLITNMLVLREIIDLGSVTVELLNIFQKQPQYSNYSFRLKVNENSQLKVDKKIIDGVDVIECSFPCYSNNTTYTDLRNSVKSDISAKIKESTRYAFGEFKVIDLSSISQLNNTELTDHIKNSGQQISKHYQELLSNNGNLGDYSELLSLFSKLVPMMNDGEDLLLIFSPCQYIVDEQDEKIKSVSFGAFAILEEQFEEPDSMFAFRLGRLEFLNLVLQWERYIQMHELSHMRGELLSAESEILKKHSQMLNLLQEPLESLTNMLNRTQEDAQTLRAILYDPHRSIFAAAPRVMKYFEENRDITFGYVKWKTCHKAESGDHETLANTIAAIVCEIFGKAELMPANIHQLYSIANGLLNSDEKAFEELRKLFEKIVEFKKIPDNNLEVLKIAFQKLKAILFTSYKDGTGDFPLLPLLVVFYDFNEESKITFKSLKDVKVTEALVNRGIMDSNILAGFNLPVPRYSSLLAFVSGVLAYVKSEPSTCEKSLRVPVSKTLSAIIDDSSIKITFDSKVFDLAKLKDTFVPLQDIIEKNMRPLYVGNFQKPFFDFAGMCVKGGREGISCMENHEFHILYEDKACIRLTETTLFISMEKTLYA